MDWAAFGVDPHLELDASAGRRTGLERPLRDAIRDGRLAPSARLPDTRALAAQLGLSRGTVSAAYDQLAAEGWLVARVGSGTEVSALRRGPAPPATPPPGPAAPRYDLRTGSPDVGTFPVADWLRGRPAGRWPPPRRPPTATGTRAGGSSCALAGYLGRGRGVLADPDRIVVTTGYVQAPVLLATVLRDAGRPVLAMEDPGLAFHREVARRQGATPHSHAYPAALDALAHVLTAR
ncbi:GntR family transcriptional regulator [Micromonospora sp. URMC 107]|uniref:GntR family transcriptional regulator n=1 Tax=Micromonospora sp. URMC 107 TaxID=3423418 RepID=UPI003F1E45DE